MSPIQTHSKTIAELQEVVGQRQVISQSRKVAAYTTGFREGGGRALAVVLPKSLLQLWKVLKIAVSHDLAIVMQAANTSLTGGATPTNGVDRDVLLINAKYIDAIHLLDKHEQIVALPGASLFDLENKLAEKNRSPHSVIGSSCLGASIVGGVCNNSGGALVERGPAYTELSLFARIDADGELRLVNNLDIELGSSPEEILERLEKRQYSIENIHTSNKKASDDEYKSWVRDTSSDRPARFNADKRRLREASGCAGKLAIFAVRLDSFASHGVNTTYLLGTNHTSTLSDFRISVLNDLTELPVSAEYMHRDTFELSMRYGRDIMSMLRFFGTALMPSFFRLKRAIDLRVQHISWLPNNLLDRLTNGIAKFIPLAISKRLLRVAGEYEHLLILTVKQSQHKEIEALFNSMQSRSDLLVLQCNEREAKQAAVIRYAAAGAAIQLATLNTKTCSGLVALDIALPRNTRDWMEVLPSSLKQKIDKAYYYGHFLCYVFHQDYIVKKGCDPNDVKKELLHLVDERGAQFPAEHNVGHSYKANDDLSNHYKQLDPTNTFNPGIGKTSKLKHYGCGCSTNKEKYDA